MDEIKMQVPIADSYWVLPGKLLAGEYPGDLDAAGLVTRLSGLLDAGIRTFLDLTEAHELPSYQRALRVLAEERGVNVTYARIPIQDMGVPSPCTLKCILDVMDRSLTCEQPIYVHCFAGHGRTGTVIGAYLKRHGLATAENLIAMIAELRSGMPSGMTLSPQTREQVELAREWID